MPHDRLVRQGRIDPASWSVEEAAEALRVQCAFAPHYQRSPASVARRRASFTLDEQRAAFWLAVAERIELQEGSHAA